MREYFLSFDDTDMPDTVGTGHILDGFLRHMEFEFDFISRHQLFVHEDVPYTSHNSSMCAKIKTDWSVEEIAVEAARWLEEHCPEGSDPGVCVAELGRIREESQAIGWGLSAKREVLTKEGAYRTADACGVHLSEHGGTGQGVVGAMAAIGLRLYGEDGRIRGKREMDAGVFTAAAILQATDFARVASIDGSIVPGDAPVQTDGEPIKAVLQEKVATIMVKRNESGFQLLTRDEIKQNF